MRLIAGVGTLLANAHANGRGLRPALVGDALRDLRAAYKLVASIAASRRAG